MAMDRNGALHPQLGQGHGVQQGGIRNTQHLIGGLGGLTNDPKRLNTVRF